MFTVSRVSALAALVFFSSVSVHAAEITIQFEGQWFSQNRPYSSYLSDPTVTAAPIDFVASVTFDPELRSYTPASSGGFYQAPDGTKWYFPPSPNSVVTYTDPTITSPVLNYGVDNPYAASGISSYAGMSHNFEAFGYGSDAASAPNQSLSFYTGMSSALYNGSQLSYWNTGLSLRSPLWSIAPEDIGPLSGAAFVDLIQKAFTTGESFSANLTSYTMLSGPAMLMYPDGMGLSGTARIVSITEVPEPSSSLLLLAGLAMASLVRRRAATKNSAN